MPSGPIHRVIRHLRHTVQPANGGERPDAELLCSFLDGRDETAFAALVRRHAAMVLGVCRRVTGDAHDAEDAFQAAFCVLLRKAGSIRRREVLGSWLYGVAYRTALAAKSRRAKTRRREQQVDAMPQPMHLPPDPGQDWQPLLDAALERLPDKYRVPIIMCDLEGKSRRTAALQLQVSEGTLSSRLARGRRLLAQRLKRHGLTLSGGALAAILAQNVASAHVPVSLVQTVSQAGAKVIVGQAPTFLAFSAPVVALTEGVMKAMLIGKLKTLALVCVIGAGIALTGSWISGVTGSAVAAADDTQVQPGAAPAQGAQPPAAAQPNQIQNIEATPAGVQLPPQASTAAQPGQTVQVQLVGPKLPGRGPNVSVGSAAVQAFYRIEAVVTLPDTKEKSFTSAPVLAPLGRRTPYEVRTNVAGADGQVRPTQVSWNVEIVRQRAADVLLNVILEKKDRQSSAVTRGQSLEFEDFVALDTWKTLTDATWPGVEFKIKVSKNVGVSAEPTTGKASTATDPFGNKAPPAQDPNAAPAGQPALPPPLDSKSPATSTFQFRHVPAGAVLDQLKQQLGGRKIIIGIDERTNSLVVRGSDVDLEAVRAAINRLDAPQPMPGADKPAADKPAADKAIPGAVALSPDTRVLAFSSDSQVMLIDAQTGKLLSKSVGDGTPKALAFSPDGKLLISGTQQGSVNIYDVPTGKQIRKIQSKMPIVQIQVSPDGRTIITITADQSRLHWDMTTGELHLVEPPLQKR